MNTKKDVITEGLLSRVAQLVNLYDSGSEFGRATGLNRQTVSLIVNKRISNLTFNTISQIIRGTRCNAEWLILGKGKPFSAAGEKPGIVSREEVSISVNDLQEVLSSDDKLKDHPKVVLKAVRDVCEIYLNSL